MTKPLINNLGMTLITKLYFAAFFEPPIPKSIKRLHRPRKTNDKVNRKETCFIAELTI